MAYRHVKITDNETGDVLVDETRVGANKSKRPVYVRELMREADDLFGDGVQTTLYFKQCGAKDFAKYRYMTGTGQCELV